MSHRTRSAKAAAASTIPPSKSKKKATSTRMKKSSASKRHLDCSSTTLTQPRQKRLSSLTAAALVHYCTSVLTPSRKSKRPSQTSTKEDKASLRKRKLSNVSCKSDPKNTQTVLHTRTRREASSRASAMIMQQNEIERSRFNYTLPSAQSTTVIRPARTKTEPPAVPLPPPPPPREPFQFNVPSTANLSKASEQPQPSVNLKYPSLTEAILAEHDRLHEPLPAHQSTKHEHLVKWTQELALCGRLSPHEMTLDSIDDDTRSQSPKPQANAKEISTSSTADSVASHESLPNPTTTPSFLFPSAGYPLDFRSLYPLMPCWQYLGKQAKP